MDEIFKALEIRWPDWPNINDQNTCLISAANAYAKDLEYRHSLLASLSAQSKQLICELISSRDEIKSQIEWEEFALRCLGEELKTQTIGEKQVRLREICKNTSLSSMQNLAAMTSFARSSYLSLAIDCLLNTLSDDNLSIEQKQYSILHLANSFNSDWHIREAHNNEVLADAVIRFFATCACAEKTDIKTENLQSVIGDFININARVGEFDDWIQLPLHKLSRNIKDGDVDEAIKSIQLQLTSGGISKEISQALARSYISKLAAKLGLWDEASKLIGESQLILNEYQKNETFKKSILPIVHAEVGLLSHELSIALANKSFNAQDIQEGNPQQRYGPLSRAQLGQDLWVLEKLNWLRDGYFVEFGATDGVLLNNSWLLEKYFGWKGICAEPNPKFLEKLKKNRQCHISDKCVFSSSNQKVEFVLADVFGGIKHFGDEDSHKAKRDSYEENGEIMNVDTISLVDLLKQYDAPAEIDYLSIDTEGSEFEILNAFDWEEYSIKCITVEHNFTPLRQEIRDLLTSKGYFCEEAKWDDWYFKN